MLIFDETDQPVIIDSIHGPTLVDYMWVLDLNLFDYTLTSLVMLEEVVCPSIQLRIKGFEFVLPASWSILVFDKETSQLDVVPLSETAGREFSAVVFGPNKPFIIAGTITVTNYFTEYKNVGPSLNKHQMLCHPIGPDEWVNVSPSDSYNKYIKDRTIGDLIGS